MPPFHSNLLSPNLRTLYSGIGDSNWGSNVSAVKLENDVDVQDEEYEYTVHMKIEEAYVPITFSIHKAEPEVSYVSR
jgi:hypothetical protein